LAQAGPRPADNMLSGQLHYSGAADIVRVLLLTGFRLEEAQGLRWQAVNLDLRVITLTDTKASRTLRMPMCDALLALMERRAAELRQPDGKLPEWVFPTTGGGRYRNLPSRVMPVLSEAVAAAVGRPFHTHAHALRHTFATYLRALGHSEWVVAALLNHSRTSSVTTLYATPMTTAMHGIVNEYENYLRKALEAARKPDDAMEATELLSGAAPKAAALGNSEINEAA
jgi:integrase